MSLLAIGDNAIWFGTSDNALVFRHDIKTQKTRALADFAGNEVSAMIEWQGSVIVAANDMAPGSTTVKAKSAMIVKGVCRMEGRAPARMIEASHVGIDCKIELRRVLLPIPGSPDTGSRSHSIDVDPFWWRLGEVLGVKLIYSRWRMLLSSHYFPLNASDEGTKDTTNPGTAIAKAHGSAIAWHEELDLEFAFVPASLGFVTVEVNHCWDTLSSS